MNRLLENITIQTPHLWRARYAQRPFVPIIGHGILCRYSLHLYASPQHYSLTVSHDWQAYHDSDVHTDDNNLCCETGIHCHYITTVNGGNENLTRKVGQLVIDCDNFATPRQENAWDCPHALDGAATNVQPLVEYWGVL